MGERKKDFMWRYQPPDGSDKAKMLTYIQNRDLHPSQDKTAMIINALTAYYMPLALISQGNEDSDRLELVTMDCLRALANQFNHLCAALSIAPQRMGGIMSGVPISSNLPSQSDDGDSSDLSNEDFDPDEWNLAGITTDSQTFEFSN